MQRIATAEKPTLALDQLTDCLDKIYANVEAVCRTFAGRSYVLSCSLMTIATGITTK
jgi:hypothetical protein